MDSRLYKEIGEAVKKAEQNGGDLTSQNLRYVETIAKQVSNMTGVDEEELFMEGVLEMIKRERKYDPSQNDNFTKSCGSSIRQVMMNYVNRQTHLVHIPVNHLQGFKKGQSKKEEANVSYKKIDASNYDSLGFADDDTEEKEREEILMTGLNKLDIAGRIAIEMKLRLGKYSEMVESVDKPGKMIYKYKNNIQSIAEELEVPVNIANKIYKSAYSKLSKYCQGVK